MRVKQPEPFDPNREYSPGERCVYRGMVLIAEKWTAADARLANNNPAIFTQRCVRCKIAPELVGNAINSIGATGKRFIGVCCVSSGDLRASKHWNLIITEQLPGLRLKPPRIVITNKFLER